MFLALVFVTENTYTPARLEALFKLSVVTILSHSYHFHQSFCGLWVFSPTRHLVRDLIELFMPAAYSVAINLVHVSANLFLSRKIDQLRCSLLHAVLRVSSVVNIFICLQSAKLSKELVDPNEGGCVST